MIGGYYPHDRPVDSSVSSAVFQPYDDFLLYDESVDSQGLEHDWTAIQEQNNDNLSWPVPRSDTLFRQHPEQSFLSPISLVSNGSKSQPPSGFIHPKLSPEVGQLPQLLTPSEDFSSLVFEPLSIQANVDVVHAQSLQDEATLRQLVENSGSSEAREKSFLCPHCFYPLKHKKDLKRHIRASCKDSGPEKPYVCRCGKLFPSTRYYLLRNHQSKCNSSAGTENFTCTCGQLFFASELMEEHYEEKHKGKRGRPLKNPDSITQPRTRVSVRENDDRSAAVTKESTKRRQRTSHTSQSTTATATATHDDYSRVSTEPFTYSQYSAGHHNYQANSTGNFGLDPAPTFREFPAGSTASMPSYEELSLPPSCFDSFTMVEEPYTEQDQLLQ